MTDSKSVWQASRENGCHVLRSASWDGSGIWGFPTVSVKTRQYNSEAHPRYKGVRELGDWLRSTPFSFVLRRNPVSVFEIVCGQNPTGEAMSETDYSPTGGTRRNPVKYHLGRRCPDWYRIWQAGRESPEYRRCEIDFAGESAVLLWSDLICHSHYLHEGKGYLPAGSEKWSGWSRDAWHRSTKGRNHVRLPVCPYNRTEGWGDFPPTRLFYIYRCALVNFFLLQSFFLAVLNNITRCAV